MNQGDILLDRIRKGWWCMYNLKENVSCSDLYMFPKHLIFNLKLSSYTKPRIEMQNPKIFNFQNMSETKMLTF